MSKPTPVSKEDYKYGQHVAISILLGCIRWMSRTNKMPIGWSRSSHRVPPTTSKTFIQLLLLPWWIQITDLNMGKLRGFPGGSHDAVIFQTTDMRDKIQNTDNIPDIGKLFQGVIISPLIVADSAFPLQPMLLHKINFRHCLI